MILGYDESGTVIESEASVVKYIFEQFNKYTANPPADLIESKIESAKEDGEVITREEAIERITMFEIECRIWDEIKENPEFMETIKQYNIRCADMKSNAKTLNTLHTEKTVTTSEPLISRELWDKVQDILKKKSVVVYARESSHPGADESLEKQKEALKSFCKRHGYKIAAEISVVGNRQDSMAALKQAIECAKESNEKTLLMASANRVVCTLEEVAEIEKLIEDAGIKILTMDQSYEQIQKYGFPLSTLITNTLAAVDDTDESDVDEDNEMDFYM